MKYDFDKVIDRRGTGAIKCQVAPRKFHCDAEDLLPLWIADTDFEVAPQIVEAINKRCEHPLFGYTTAQPDYAPAVADFYNRRYNLGVDPKWILPSTCVMTAMYFAVLAVTEPEDKLMVMTPIYDPFYGVVVNTGRVQVECPLVRNDDTYTIDFDLMEQQMKDGVKVLLFCNPHNPTGRVWTREEMDKITGLCEKYGVAVHSDEVHGDMTMSAHPYISMLEYKNLHENMVVYTSPAKTFNLAGMDISNLIIPNPELKNKVNQKLRSGFVKNPPLLSLTATQAAYTYGDEWLDQAKAYIEANSEYVLKFISENMPKIHPAKHEGTYLMWLDCSCFNKGDALSQDMVDHCHVALGAGGGYGAGYEQFQRLNIGTARANLEEALNRILKYCNEVVK